MSVRRQDSSEFWSTFYGLNLWKIGEKLLCVYTRIKPLENLSLAYQILCWVHYLSIERPPAWETSNTRIYSKTLWLAVVNFPSKNTSNCTSIFAGKDKRVQELFDARETTCKLCPYQLYKGICHDLVNSSTFCWKMPRYECREKLIDTERNLQVASWALKSSWTLFSFPSKNSSTIACIFGGKINCNQSQQSMSGVYLFQNRSKYWMFPVQVVLYG